MSGNKNFTPGPWRAPEHAPWQIVDDRYSTGTAVAIVQADRGHGRAEGETFANARLIASAPDMVELIAGFVRYHGECMGDMEDPQMSSCRGFNPWDKEEPCPWCKGMGILDELCLLDREKMEPII